MDNLRAIEKILKIPTILPQNNQLVKSELGIAKKSILCYPPREEKFPRPDDGCHALLRKKLMVKRPPPGQASKPNKESL